MQNRKLHMFIPAVLVAALFAAMDASAVTTRTWDGGGTTTNWSDGNNWSPNGVPASTDPVVFNGTATKNCTVTAADSCGSISVNSGYTGTISLSANLTVNGSLTLNSLTATFNCNGSTLTVEGSLIRNSGSFLAGTGTVSLTSSTAAMVSGGLTFKNLEVNKGAHVTLSSTIANPVIVTGTLTLSNGYLDSGVLCARGTTIDQNTGFDGGTGELCIDGTGTQYLNGSGSNTYGDLPKVTIKKPANSTLYLQSIIRLSRNWAYETGTVNVGTSTVRFVDLYDPKITGNTQFYDLDIALDAVGDQLEIIDEVTVNGTLNHNSGAFKLPNSKKLYIKGDVSTVASGTSVTPGTSTLEICGTGLQNIDLQDKTYYNINVTNTTNQVRFTEGFIQNTGSYFRLPPGGDIEMDSTKDFYVKTADWHGTPTQPIKVWPTGDNKWKIYFPTRQAATYINIKKCRALSQPLYAYSSTDSAGNEFVYFGTDTTPPTIYNLAPTVSYINANDPNPPGPFVAYYSDSQSGVNLSGITALLGHSYTDWYTGMNLSNAMLNVYFDHVEYSVSQFSEGTYSWTINVPDWMGNTSSANVTFTVDRVAPVVTSISPSDGGFASPSPLLSATFHDYTSGGFFDGTGINGSATVVLLDGTNITSLVLPTPDGFSYQLPYALNGAVSHTLTVTVVDLAGNVTTATSTFQVNRSPTVASPIADLAATEDLNPAAIDLATVFSDLDVSAGYGDSLTYSVTGNTNASLVTPTVAAGFMVLSLTPNANGTAALTVRAMDNFGLYVEDTFQLTVNPVNDAPQLASGATFALTSIAEDATSNSGTAITQLIASGSANAITDVDAGALQGLAITGKDATNGSWQFTTNNGGAWNTVGTVSDSAALLLAADVDGQGVPQTRIRFVPAANFNGSIGSALVFRAWDRTAGTNGTTANVTTNGGTTAFSQTAKTASLVVTEVNDLPTAAADAKTTAENSILSFQVSDLAANDTKGPANEDGQTLTVLSVDSASVQGGTVTLVNGTVTYSPPSASFNGTDSFNYTVRDNGTTNGSNDFKTASGTVTVTATEVNDSPTAVADSKSMTEGAALTFPVTDLLANDSRGPANESGQTLTVISVSATSTQGGSVVLAGGNITYTPSLTFNGPDSFTYTIQDNGTTNGANDFKTATGTVTVTVSEVNDAPTAVADGKSTAEDSALTFPATDLVANDSKGPANEIGQTLTVISVSAASAQGGTISLAGGTVTYTPQADFNGSDSFTYTIQDNGTTNGVDDFKMATGTVTVTVSEVNDLPTAVADSKSTAEDVPLAFPASDLLANDTRGPAPSEDGQTLTVISVGAASAQGGTVSLAGGTVTYTPKADFNGIDSFTYTVQDSGTTNGVDDFKSATATVTIAVSEVNDPPIAVADNKSTTENVGLTFLATELLANDTRGPSPSEDGQALTVASVGAASEQGGTVSLAGGSITYEPPVGFNGSDSFTYTIEDNGTTNGVADPKTATGTIVVAVEPQLPPVAQDGNLIVDEDPAVPAGGFLSASDVNGDDLTYSIAGNGTKGIAEIVDASTGAFTYTPNENANGEDTFTFVANDGTADSNTATITVTINPVNDAPYFVAGFNQTVPEDSGAWSVASWALGINAGPLDEATQALSFTFSSTNAGLFTLPPSVALDGTLSFTVNPDANGSSIVTVTLHDDGGTENGGVDTNAQSFLITILPSQDAPVAFDDSFTTDEDVAFTGFLSAGDVDGDPLTYSIVANGAHGTATLVDPATGEFTYTPNADDNGTDSFTIKANDGLEDSNTATVTVTINPVADFRIDSVALIPTEPFASTFQRDGIVYTGYPEARVQVTVFSDSPVASVTIDGLAANLENGSTYSLVFGGWDPNTWEPLIPDGPKDFQIQVQDGSGNTISQVFNTYFDYTPPELTDLMPANGTTVASGVPDISASFDYEGVGVNPNSLEIRLYPEGTLQEVIVDQNGFEVIYPVGLTPFGNNVWVRFLDELGREVVFNEWDFAYPERTEFDPPSILDLKPANGSSTSDLYQVVSAALVDPVNPALPEPPSGLDANSLKVFLDWVEITGANPNWQLELDTDGTTLTGFTLTPLIPLLPGVHTLIVSIADNQRNVATSISTFTIDRSAPALAFQQPAQGTIVASDRPFIHAYVAADPSGVDVSSLLVRLDGAFVQPSLEFAGSTTPPVLNGFSFTPAAPLAQGIHTVTVSLADLARPTPNYGNSSWSFVVDSAGPAVTFTSPEPALITNDTLPVFAGTFSDTVSGINANSFKVELVSGGGVPLDVTQDAALDGSSGFTYTPAVPLVEGTHAVVVTIKDGLGNQASGSASVEIDLTPPAAPVATLITHGPDRVAFYGPIEPDVTGVIAVADGFDVESGVDTEWSVIVRKLEGETFALEVKLVDAAGNVSQPTVFNDAVLPPGPGGEPEYPPLVINQFLVEAPKLEENGIKYFDKTELKFTAKVSGGQEPLTVTIDGNPILGVAGQYNQSLIMAEGPADAQLQVTDAGGQTASQSISIVVDATPPEIAITSPTLLTTAPLGFLFVNGLNDTEAASVRTDPDLPRNVYAHASFGVSATATDGESSIDNPSFKLELRETDALANDIKYPYVDYAASMADSVESLLEEDPLPESAQVVRTLTNDTPEAVAADFTHITTDLEDSTRDENETTQKKIYLLTVTAKDKLENTATASMWVKVDTTAPAKVTSGYSGRLASSPVDQATHTVTLVPGPWLGVGVGDEDIVRVFDSTTALKRAWVDGPWIFESSLDVANVNEAGSDGGLLKTFTLEDLAGNKSPVDVTATYENSNLGLKIESGDYDDWEYYSDKPIFSGNNDPGNEYPFGTPVRKSNIVNRYALRQGDQFSPNEYPSIVNDGIRTTYLQHVVGEQVTHNGILMGAEDSEPTIPYVALTPSWSEPRAYSVRGIGTYPYGDGGTLGSTSQNFLVGPDFADLSQESAAEDDVYNDLTVTSPTFTFPTFTLPWSTVKSDTNVLLKTKTTIYPTSFNSVKPGLQYAGLAYGATTGSWTRTTRNVFSEPYTFEVNGVQINGSKVHETRWINREEGTIAPSVAAARQMTVFQVTPDTIVAGQQTKVLIKGYFGDQYKPGDAIDVSFQANGGTGELTPVPQTLRNPQTNELTTYQSGYIEDGEWENRSTTQTISVWVNPPIENAPFGVFDVTFGSTNLPNSINVIVCQLDVLTLNDRGEAVRPDEQIADNPIPEVIASIDKASITSDGLIKLDISGNLKDALSEVAPTAEGTIHDIVIYVNGEETKRIPVTYGPAQPPWKNRTLDFNFDTTVIADCIDDERCTVRIEAVNAADSAGFTHWQVPIEFSNIEGNYSLFSLPEASSIPAFYYNFVESTGQIEKIQISSIDSGAIFAEVLPQSSLTFESSLDPAAHNELTSVKMTFTSQPTLSPDIVEALPVRVEFGTDGGATKTFDILIREIGKSSMQFLAEPTEKKAFSMQLDSNAQMLSLFYGGTKMGELCQAQDDPLKYEGGSTNVQEGKEYLVKVNLSGVPDNESESIEAVMDLYEAEGQETLRIGGEWKRQASSTYVLISKSGKGTLSEIARNRYGKLAVPILLAPNEVGRSAYGSLRPYIVRFIYKDSKNPTVPSIRFNDQDFTPVPFTFSSLNANP